MSAFSEKARIEEQTRLLYEQNPNLDLFICETIVKAGLNGTLEKYDFDIKPEPVKSQIIQTLTVDNPKK